MEHAGQSIADLSRRVGLAPSTLTDQLHGLEKLGPEVEAALLPTARQFLYRRLREQADIDHDEALADDLVGETMRAGASLGELMSTVDEARADGVIDDHERRQIATAAAKGEERFARIRRMHEGKTED
jgi:DNA-binding IclR family transcriptional regulator